MESVVPQQVALVAGQLNLFTNSSIENPVEDLHSV